MTRIVYFELQLTDTKLLERYYLKIPAYSSGSHISYVTLILKICSQTKSLGLIAKLCFFTTNSYYLSIKVVKTEINKNNNSVA